MVKSCNHPVMNKLPKNSLFVTGTGTDVGKTFVTSLIAKCLADQNRKVGVYKPVSSGCALRDGELVSTDAESLWEAAGRPGRLMDVSPQKFLAPLAPNVAARAEGKTVDSTRIRTDVNVWSDSDALLVEGVGGLLSPISDHDLVVDLAVEYAIPVLVVAANRLGCINDTLQTLIVARHYGLNVVAVALNDVEDLTMDQSRSSNLTEIRRLSDVPHIFHLTHNCKGIDPTVVAQLIGDE